MSNNNMFYLFLSKVEEEHGLFTNKGKFKRIFAYCQENKKNDEYLDTMIVQIKECYTLQDNLKLHIKEKRYAKKFDTQAWINGELKDKLSIVNAEMNKLPPQILSILGWKFQKFKEAFR